MRLLTAALLLFAVAPLSAQQASCGVTCGLRIEHRLLGDRLIDASGARVGPRMLQAQTVQTAVQGVPLAEAWARIHVQSDRKARLWGGLASIATLALLMAENNDMYGWEKSDQQAMIWGSAIGGFVFGGIASRHLRTSLDARGAALAAYNAARPAGR